MSDHNDPYTTVDASEAIKRFPIRLQKLNKSVLQMHAENQSLKARLKNKLDPLVERVRELKAEKASLEVELKSLLSIPEVKKIFRDLKKEEAEYIKKFVSDEETKKQVRDQDIQATAEV